MKSVLISIQPKWVEKIASGKKTIEVRKSKPKLETPFKCYIYATKPKKWFRFSSWGYASDESLWLSNGKVKMCNGFEFWADDKEYEPLCGKVIGEFVCDKVYDLKYVPTVYYGKPAGTYEEMICNSSCLSVDQIKEYAKGRDIYGWHISDLKIYDKPKELSEFNRIIDKCVFNKDGVCQNRKQNQVILCKNLDCDCKKIVRPPQSWCYVESGVQCE